MDNAGERLLDLKAERRVRKALAKWLRDIKKEPTIVIESPQDESQDSAQSVNDVLGWLFRRR